MRSSTGAWDASEITAAPGMLYLSGYIAESAVSADSVTRKRQLSIKSLPVISCTHQSPVTTKVFLHENLHKISFVLFFNALQHSTGCGSRSFLPSLTVLSLSKNKQKSALAVSCVYSNYL